MKDKVIAVLKVAISLGLMAYLLYRFLHDPVDREVLLRHLTTANYGYLLLGLLLFITAVITNSIKWYILLRAQGVDIPFQAVNNYTFVGQFFNNFLPANVGGDVMRGFGLARYTARNTDAAVSVIVDRLIGLMAFMFTAVVAALVAVNIVPQGQSPAEQRLAGALAQIEVLAMLGMGVMAVGFAVMLSHRLRQLMGKFLTIGPLQRLLPVYQPISAALGAYRYQYSALLGAFAVGVGTVLLTGLVDIAIVAGLNGHIPAIYIFLLNPIIAILLIAPISIGGLGTGSVLYVELYTLLGASGPLVFALSLFKQAIIYLGSLPGGILWLRRRDSRPDQVKATSLSPEKAETAAPSPGKS